ncbi:MAG: extracellular solute-binding protein [Clostridia bacterium]|nr:extracellular solute-binding protein [Clostridia bacterium]
MKKLLKLFSVALTVCIFALAVLSVTGCGKNKPSSDIEDLYPGVTFNEKNGEMYKDTKEEKTRIKISYSTGQGNAWIRRMAYDFLIDEEGADYYFVLDGDSELTSAVSSKLEAGVGLSEIYMPLASGWNAYASLGYLENLNDLYSMTVPGESVTVGEKIRGSWTDYGKAVVQGSLDYYIFPWNEHITGIVYNKTMFDTYGWAIPETTDDLLDLCNKIVTDTKGRIAPFVYPGTISGGYWDFLGTNWWAQVAGTERMDEFMKFESAEKSFSYMKETDLSYGKLVMLEEFERIIVKNREKFILKGSGSKTHLTAQLSFAQGQAAMIPTGSWVENESFGDMEDEAAMMPTPVIKNETLKDENGNYIRVNYSGQPDYIFIPSGIKEEGKEGAKKFLAFMCKDEELVRYTNVSGAPRPFDYDIGKCETSAFIQSCINVWKDSTTWFEKSTSKLWTANKCRKFNSNSPYTYLLANPDTATAIGWCANELASVQRSWPQWLEQVGE